ncbi:TonB-dependent siderophore receptor [Jiella sp. MQZ13P-4]|uniref:TonB-dependent siderophore receptor n=1 Tax=Jiella sonneratiae TaxID=2816856 RepID=A0ABS3J4U6_9HYPH|nr:TonB-dependent siderophore receptor [Jiella sonneratiae]
MTRKQLDLQDPDTVGEALLYTSGVLADRDTNSRYDSVFLRGFGAFGTSTSYVSYLDGLKLPRGQAFAQTAIDPYLLDRIDVIKGASGLLYGQVSPGGLVNQVSRAASATPSHEIFVEGGTDGRIQGGATWRGALVEDGSVQYSLTTIGRYSGTRYEDVDEGRFAVAPALTFEPDADTRLTILGYYQKDPEGGYFNSLYPDFLAPSTYRSYLNRGLNVGDPDFDSFDREEYGVGYQFEHRFNDLATVRSNLRYSSVDLDFQSLQMAGPITAAGLIPRQALRSIENVGGVSTDNQVELEFDTGAIGHAVLAGFDYQHSRSSWEYRYGLAPSLDVTNPVYGQPIAPLVPIIDSDQTLQQTGLYLQDQLSFGNFRAVLGARHDWADQETENLLAGTSNDQSNEANSYRAGLLYLFDNGLAPYASYSTSFEPEVGVDPAGNAFVPSTAEQYEVGVKYAPPGMDALFTAAAFDITKKNALVPDAIGFSRQEGEIRSRGLEFEARGSLTRNIEVIGAVTLLDVEVTQAAVAANVGNRPQAVPDYYGSLWANYSFTDATFDGLTVGGGLRVVGPSYADDANTIEADGYALVDLALRYDFGRKFADLDGLQATLNVTNLFDKDYYSSCSSNIYCQFGNGRQILAGLKKVW